MQNTLVKPRALVKSERKAPTPEREESGGAKRPNSPEGFRKTRKVQRFGGQLNLMRVEFHKEI